MKWATFAGSVSGLVVIFFLASCDRAPDFKSREFQKFGYKCKLYLVGTTTSRPYKDRPEEFFTKPIYKKHFPDQKSRDDFVETCMEYMEKGYLEKVRG